MSFDKSRFTVNPQHDSEGFTDYEARCLGCPNTAPCPRSGTCLRYDSPLREPSYFEVEARTLIRISETQPSVWSLISNEDLERVHDYWTRQAVLA